VCSQCNDDRSPTDTPEGSYDPNISHTVGNTKDKMMLFWIWTACGFIGQYCRFGVTFCLPFPSDMTRFRYTLKCLNFGTNLIILHSV